MQTDLHSSPRNFDPNTAQAASLGATLARVRFRRRVRRTTAASVVLIAICAAVWLTIPDGTPRPGPQPVAESIRFRSIPLAAGQRIVSTITPGLYIRTPEGPSIAMRVTTPAGTDVPRLGESEFRALLAAHNAYIIQLGGSTPEVRSLHAE